MHKQAEKHFVKAKDVVFFHIQTVFEGFTTNTPERGKQVAASHDIKVPVGYDARVDGARTSGIMHRFGTGGTPWTIVIDKRGKVAHNAVTPADAKALIKLIDKKRKGR